MIKAMKKTADPYPEYRGAGKAESLRMAVADAICAELGKMAAPDRKEKCLAIDTDLEGSTGLKKIREQFPEIYVKSGIMERQLQRLRGLRPRRGEAGHLLHLLRVPRDGHLRDLHGAPEQVQRPLPLLPLGRG